MWFGAQCRKLQVILNRKKQIIMCIITSALYCALTKIQRSKYIHIARAIVNYIAMGTNKLESKHMASYINYIIISL